MARYESGLTWAAAELLAGRLDATFGRFAGLALPCGPGSTSSRCAMSRWPCCCPRTTPWPGCPRCRWPRWRARPSTRGGQHAHRGVDGPGAAALRRAGHHPRAARPAGGGGGGVPAGDGEVPGPHPRRGEFSATAGDGFAAPGGAGTPFARVPCVAKGNDPPRFGGTAQVGGRIGRGTGLVAASRGLLAPGVGRRGDGSASNVSAVTQKVAPQTHNLRVRYIRCSSTV